MQFSVGQAAGTEQLKSLVSLACWLLGGQLRELLLIHIFQISQHAFSNNVSFLIREFLMISLSSDMIEPILSRKNQRHKEAKLDPKSDSLGQTRTVQQL